MTRSRVEWSLLAAATALYLWTLALRQRPMSWAASSLYVPTGLIVLSFTNTFLRAKGLAWGIFTVALIVFMIIVGTWVVMDRAMEGPPSADFARTMALYGTLAASGLFQLRVSSVPKGDTLR